MDISFTFRASAIAFARRVWNSRKPVSTSSMRSIFWLNFLEGPKTNSEPWSEKATDQRYAIPLPSGGRRRNHHPLFLLQRSGAITRHKLALFSGALLAVSCDYRSSRQPTRSSTAHQFCTTARLRGLNGEPCGLVQTDALEAAWTDEGARRPFHPHSYFLAVGGNTPIKRRYIAASA
jgi:hypothetical protein